MAYFRAFGGSGGAQGYSVSLSTYTSNTQITCPFKWTKVQAIYRRSSDSVLMAATYTKGDATQNYYQGTTMNAVAIGASGWNSIISDAQDNYITINGNTKDMVVAFIKE